MINVLMSRHYVATLVIKRVEHYEDQPSMVGRSSPTHERKVLDVASLTVQNGDLSKLLTLVGSHLELVTDDTKIPGETARD